MLTPVFFRVTKAWTVSRASYNKDFENIGVTVHFVDEGIDLVVLFQKLMSILRMKKYIKSL